MKTLKEIGIVAVILAFMILIMWVGQISLTPIPTPTPAPRATGLNDRNDVMIMEGNTISDGPQYYPNMVMYGMYEGKVQFYTINEKGVTFPLEDRSDQPQETWSVIIK